MKFIVFFENERIPSIIQASSYNEAHRLGAEAYVNWKNPKDRVTSHYVTRIKVKKIPEEIWNSITLKV